MKNKVVKRIGIVLGIVVLIGTGVTGTISVQKYNNDLKAQGVREYKATCDMYQNNEKTQKWLECDV
jgi:hypothetical protein